VKRAWLAVALAILGSAPVAAASGGHCHERSSIVGRARCSSFGDGWAERFLEGLQIGFMSTSGVTEHLVLPSLAAVTSGTAYNATGSAAYRASFAPGTRRTIQAIGLRSGLRWEGRHLIVGLELEGAGSTSSPTVVTMVDGAPSAMSASASVLDAAGYVGVHQRLGRFDLGAVVVVGVRDIEDSVHFPDGYSTCVGGVTGRSCYAVISIDQLLVEPRASVGVWLSPYLTLSAEAGVDLADRAESFALAMRVHISPFDGD
jgi:hypothetical protein